MFLVPGVAAGADMLTRTVKITTVTLRCRCGKAHAIGVTITPQAYTDLDPDIDFELPDNCLRCGSPLDTYANCCVVMEKARESVEVLS